MRVIFLSAALLALLSPVWVTAQTEPSTKPAASAPPEVALPNGWEARKSTLPHVLQFAKYSDPLAFFELSADAREDFVDSTDLMAWAKLVKASTAKSSRLLNREETELRQNSIAGRTTVEYEITGEFRNIKLHYRMIMLQVGGYYCKLGCWTTPSNWDAAQPKFDELVSYLN